jgi:DNA-binding response OmpR family regulator
VVGVDPENERAVLVHWAVSSGYFGLPAEREHWDAIQCESATVLVFDDRWTHNPVAACRTAWARGAIPIVVLESRATWEPHDILAQPNADFVRRPYDPEDAFARVRRAMTAAQQRQRREVPNVPGLSVDATTQEASFAGRRIRLRRAEFRLLSRLLDAAPNPVCSSEIVEEVLGTHGSGGTARNQIYEVRRKLARVGAPAIIETIRGSGAYCIRPRSDIDLTRLNRAP